MDKFLENFTAKLKLYSDSELSLPSEYIQANNKKVDEDIKTNNNEQYYSSEQGRTINNFKEKLTKGLIAENLVRYISGLPPTSKGHEAQYYTPPDININNNRVEIKSLEINNNASYRNGWATDISVLTNAPPMILISSDKASEECNQYSISISKDTSMLLWPYTDTRKAFFYFYIPSDGYIDIGDKSIGGAVQNPRKIIFIPRKQKTIRGWINSFN